MKTCLEAGFLVAFNSLATLEVGGPVLTRSPRRPDRLRSSAFRAASDLHVEVLGVIERSRPMLVLRPAPPEVSRIVVGTDQLLALGADRH